MTPFGILAPIVLYFAGFLRKSTISSSSSFSSFSPATSLKVTFLSLSDDILALLLPKFTILALPAPPPPPIAGPALIIIIIIKNITKMSI